MDKLFEHTLHNMSYKWPILKDAQYPLDFREMQTKIIMRNAQM